MILAIILGLIIGWLFYNNEATYKLLSKATYVVYQYTLANPQNKPIKELVKAYDEMIYSYDYVFWHPRLESAIKPEYRELLEPYCKDSWH